MEKRSDSQVDFRLEGTLDSEMENIVAKQKCFAVEI